MTKRKQVFRHFCKFIKKHKYHIYITIQTLCYETLNWAQVNLVSIDHPWDVSTTWLQATCGKLNWLDMIWKGPWSRRWPRTRWSLWQSSRVPLWRWLSFWKVLPSPQRNSGALSEWPSGSWSPPWPRPFPNHVQSIEFTTGEVQSSCWNISRMINGNRMHLSTILSLIAKGLNTYVNNVFLLIYEFANISKNMRSLCHYGVLCVDWWGNVIHFRIRL